MSSVERVKDAAFYLSRQAVVPHFAVDVATAFLVEYPDFLINKAISREVLASQGLVANGEPVMFVEGFGMKSKCRAYRNFRDKLAEEAGYTVYPSGIRGRNWGDFGKRIDEVDVQLVSVSKEHGNSPVIMVGHSLGGPIIRVMIKRHPDLVASGNYLASPLDAYPDQAVDSLWVKLAAKGFLRINDDIREELHEATSNGSSSEVPERSYIPENGGVLNLAACRNGQVERREGRGRSHVGSPVNAQIFIELLRDFKQDRERIAA